MDTIYDRIKTLSRNNDKHDEFRQYTEKTIDELVKHLQQRILNSDGAYILDCIFRGLADNLSNCDRRVKIADIILKTMRKNSTSMTHCGDIVSRLCLEFRRLPVQDLVRWSDDCVQSIKEGTDVNMIWRDVLPECINAISTNSCVKKYDGDVSALEYTIQCVEKLCECTWTESQLVQLTAMFKDLQLSRGDHKQVVNKICTYIIDLPPESLPPLVYQLLKLCKVYNLEIVLSHLTHYFNARLYNKLEPPPSDSESTTMDLDDIEQYNPAELSRCLSTCLYHICQGVADPELVKKHVKNWPKTQVVRSPFLIDLALAISEKGSDFRSACLDVIRSAIEQRAMDELRSKESVWVRSLLPPDVNVANTLKVITKESANNRQLTVLGLINLAFSLLSISRTKPVAPKCWSHGNLILVQLCKSQPETAPHILSQLADRLAGDCSQWQYAECLYLLCKLTPVSVERCSQLGVILESCHPGGGGLRPAAAVLRAVHPLIGFSARTRDTLVMVCRKGLYSRDSNHRCLALSGFLTVLKHIKLARGPLSSSQNGNDLFNTHSYLTQLTVDLHATHQGSAVTSRVRNEAMCLEVVSILRRCLFQDAAVKQLLYTELYDCARDKTALHESILELMHEHLSKYLSDGDDGPPLAFDKCVQVTGATAVLVEPMGHLLYVIAQFLQFTEEEDDILSSQNESGSTFLRNKLGSIMSHLCTRDLTALVDMDDLNHLDLIPESKVNYIKIQQILHCYEALIAHQIMQWSAHNSNGAAVVRMFKEYTQLLERAKAPSKLSKKASKTLNETRETMKSQKSQKSQKERKSPNKFKNMVKDRAGPFKPLPCLWDLRLCLRVVELLYGECVVWSSLAESNKLRSSAEFQLWALRCALCVLTSDTQEFREAAKHILDIATLLYKRCICRFEDMWAFDSLATSGCLDVFKTCITLLYSPNHSLKVDNVLINITGHTECSESASMAAILEQLYNALTHVESDETGEKKLAVTLLQATAALLALPLQSCTALSVAVVHLEDFVRQKQLDCLQLIPALLTASYRQQHEALFLEDVLVKLATVLGRIDDDNTSIEEDNTNFPSITSRNGQSVLSMVCGHLAARCKCTEHLLVRVKDLTAALALAPHGHYQRIDKELRELYKSIVNQLCHLSTWTCAISRLRCAVGVNSDAVLGACTRLYALLTTFAKQLPLQPTLLADANTSLRSYPVLDRLMRLSGKKLSSIKDNLISYLAKSREGENANKVLRDTKLIPRLVLQEEQFTKHVRLLDKKCHTSYVQYLSLGTAREFTIKEPVVQEILNSRAVDEINDAVTEIQSSDGEGEQSEVEDGRRKKRRRMSSD